MSSIIEVPLSREDEINDDLTNIPDEEAPYGRKADGTPRKKPGRPAGSTNSGSLSKRTARFNLDKEEIADLLVEKVSLPVAVYSPLASFVIDDRAEKTAEALLVLAKHSPRLAKALAKAQQYGAVFELALLPLGIVTALLVEFGRLKPDSQVSIKFNIDVGYERLYGQNGSEGMGFAYERNGHKVEPRSGLL